MWSGSNSTSFATAPFKVTNTGDVTANSLTLTGETVIENGNDASIFITTNTDGIGVYNDANTAFYVDGNENFSLGEKLTWDGTTLNISGNVDITGGGALTLIQSAQDTADDAYSEAITRILPGELEARIGDSVTNISGGKITTGTINADLINAGTLSADRIFGGTISGSSINVDFDIRCGTGTLRVGNNRGLQSDGTFATTTSTTTCRVHNFGSFGSEVFRNPASRRELKENIEDISDATEILKKLRPRKFNWKIDAHDSIDPTTGEPWTDEAKAINKFNKAFGFIAEEVAEDYPALALYSSPKHLPSEDPESYFDINSWTPAMWKDMDMIPLLVKSIQELSARVEELESKLNS